MGSAEAPELPIVDCRLSIEIDGSIEIRHSNALNRQSSIENRQSAADCRLKRWCGNFLRCPLELPIFDCRLEKMLWQLPPLSTSPSTDGSIEVQRSERSQSSIGNRQSSIENRQSKIVNPHALGAGGT
jgi:hypothetical protein